MSRLEEAKKRLDTAVRKLDAVVQAQEKPNGADRQTLEALARARADYAMLRETTESARGRLDGTIGKLQTLLDA